MNLGQQIAKILLEQDRKTIAIFPGAFKPPHKGHVEVIKKLLQTQGVRKKVRPVMVFFSTDFGSGRARFKTFKKSDVLALILE